MAFSKGAVFLQILVVIICTPWVIYFGAKLLEKVAEVLFGPSLEDVCTQCKVPQRTAAIIFMALANGAPDLAAAIVSISNHSIKIEQRVDMSFGALLGAGCFVTMFVLACILKDMPEGRSLKANPAFFRDVLSYGLPLASLPVLHATVGGLTKAVCITFIVYYILLTGLVAYGDFWHYHMDRYLPEPMERGMQTLREYFSSQPALDDGFEPLDSPSDSVEAPLLDHQSGDMEHHQIDSPTTRHNAEQERFMAATERRHARTVGLMGALGGDDNLSHGFNYPPRLRIPNDTYDRPTALPIGVFSPFAAPGTHDMFGPDRPASSPTTSPGTTPSVHPSDSASQQIIRSAHRFEMETSRPRLSKDVLEYSSDAACCPGLVNIAKNVLMVLLPPAPSEDDFIPPSASTSASDESEELDDFDWAHFGSMGYLQRLRVFFLCCFMVPFRLFTPTLAHSHYDPHLLVVAMFFTPPAFVGLTWGFSGCSGTGWGIVALLSVVLAATTFSGFVPHSRNQNAPLAHPPAWAYNEVKICCFSVPIILAGFSLLTMTMAVLVIQLVAGELIGSLAAFGLMTKCPEALLGVGLSIVNSMGDLATNMAAAKRSERMAFASCFSSQAFNLLLAPAIGGLISLQRDGDGVIPLNFSYEVWAMVWAMLLFFLVLLVMAVMGSSLSVIGEPYSLGRGFHPIARAAFAIVLAVVVMAALPGWIKSIVYR